MNSPVKKVVAGKPIEKLLMNSSLLPVDNSSINDSLARLQDLRQRYIQTPQSGKNVFKLPRLKK
ncbi:hypothetical protein [Rufibacter tibetensis]|uniref:Uncharacterized protein n=1 Tax=Rufibacter tibetensis TaxID=512763 RepID=A0A0P0CTL8_9BACT|nr:hypothetical protein [Rufibacter tibetensis]ALI99962.1 hypothetical protein DC20_14510 [Rufibacter tibetensis]